MTTTCRTRPIKRNRRCKADVCAIREAIRDLLIADNPQTVRQLFYRLVSGGVVDKTEGEYKATVCRLLADMRREHVIPFDWIADNTRWMRKPRTFDSLDHMLQLTTKTYRRALWNDQDVYVEVWLEKDALAGVLFDVTAQFDVPLMVTRGYPSLSFLHSAAEAIGEQDKPAYLYYLGDHDPSGVDIPRFVEASIRELAPDAEIHFERVAVLPEQIEELNLPTRPTKKSDSRSAGFEGESVEVDAIPAAKLRELVRDCIVDHLDVERLERLEAVEDAERATLQTILAGLRGTDTAAGDVAGR